MDIWTILGLLSCSEKINEFPIVQSEAVEVVSNNITEIVYSKIVHSSKRSSTKTFNFLKFLNYICMKRQFHYGPKSYEIYIENYEKQLVKVEEILLLDKVKLELEDIPGVFYNKVTTFYEKRNSRRRDKLQTLIRLNQGKKLKNDSNLFPLNNISHYETSQSLIDSLFNKEQSKITGNIRKKTIRFGYALIRFSKDDYCLRILHTILQKLVSYGTLEEFENQFLLDVWTMKGDASISTVATHVEDVLVKHFKELTPITTFNSEDSVVRIYIAEGASVINVRSFSDGLVSITVDYSKKDRENKLNTYNTMLEIEKELQTKIEGLKWSRTFPSIKPDQSYRYYLTSDNRLTEYDVEEMVFDEVSPYQRVQIVRSTTLGHILVLDTLQNLAESDVIYTHTLMQKGKENYKDKSILILGGGDGALLYELLKENPKEVIMLELDEVVMKACAKYMRSACGTVLDNYEGENYKIIVGDCIPSLEKYQKEGKKFDYVFGDLTDVPISVDQSKELWDFIDVILNRSFEVLNPNGKFMTHVNGVGTPEAMVSYKKHLESLKFPVTVTTDEAYVPSFFETWSFCQVSRAGKTEQ